MATGLAEQTRKLAHRTLESPIGPLLIAATPAGLVRIAFAGEGEDEEQVLAELAERIGPGTLNAPGALDAPATLELAARQLDEYFAGGRRIFDLPLDLQLARGFRLTVLEAMAKIPYGETVSYAALAAATGRPHAVRAVGTACATNPLPIVIPCHRVLRSDGSLGGYGGGLDAKRVLLALEAG